MMWRSIQACRDGVAAIRQDVLMSYEVTVTDVQARPTVVVPATTTWQQLPTLWGELLGQVRDCLHAAGIYRGCRNIMLCWDGVPNVEVGVLLDRACPLTGRVVASALPPKRSLPGRLANELDPAASARHPR
jgi:hypothetical protein